MSSSEGVEKREKASAISDSVAAEILCSLASLDWRGFFSCVGAGVEVGGRRLGGYSEGRVSGRGTKAIRNRSTMMMA